MASTRYSCTRSTGKWRESQCSRPARREAILAAMSRKSLLVGLGQVRVTMGDKEANTAELFRAVEEAAAAKCDVLALPECSLAGWLSSSARSAAEVIPGALTQKLKES